MGPGRALGDAEPPQALKNFDGIQLERIAALRPDLILAIFSYIERGDYDRLSQIAPTVAQPEAFVNYAAPWQSYARRVGQAVGQIERAEELVTGVEAAFARARAAHPEFTGATAVLAAPTARRRRW